MFFTSWQPSLLELPSSPSGGAEDARWTLSGVCPPCPRGAYCALRSSFLFVEPGEGKEKTKKAQIKLIKNKAADSIKCYLYYHYFIIFQKY